MRDPRLDSVPKIFLSELCDRLIPVTKVTGFAYSGGLP